MGLILSFLMLLSLETFQAAADVKSLPSGYLVDGVNPSVVESSDLTRELIRRIVKIEPEWANDRAISARWLERLGSGPRPIWQPMQGLYSRFRGGTEFDQTRALNEMRSFLEAQATAAPLKLVRIRRGVLAQFDSARGGFPISYRNDDVGLSNEMTFAWGQPPALRTYIQDWPSVALLPMAPQQAESLARRLGPGRYVDLALRMTLENFSREGRMSGPWLHSTGKVEEISLHLLPTAQGEILGQSIGSLPVKAEELAGPQPLLPPVSSPIESWSRLGARVDGGKVIIRGIQDPAGGYTDTRLIYKPLELLALARAPSSAATLPNVYHLSSRYLAPSQHASLFARQVDFAYIRALNGDVFRRHDIIERFNRDFLPSLVAQAPQLPIPIKFGEIISVGDYDFTSGSFPINSGVGSLEGGSLRFYPGGLSFPVQTDLKELPRRFAVPPGTARLLAERLSKGDPASSTPPRALYLGVDAELNNIDVGTAPARNDSGTIPYQPLSPVVLSGRLQARVVRVVIYEDPGLTKPVAEFNVDELRVKQAQKPIDLLPTLPSPTVQSISTFGLVGLAARVGAGADFVEKASMTSAAYRNANEFDRPALLTALQDEVRLGTPAPGSLVAMRGQVTLGEYDGKAAFRIGGWRFDAVDNANKPRPDSRVVITTVENPEALSQLPVPPELGQAMLTSAPSRTFPAVFIVTPRIADRTDTYDSVQARLTLRVEELVVLHPRDQGRAIARSTAHMSADTSPATSIPGAVSLTEKPDRIPFDADTFMLLGQKYSAREHDMEGQRIHLQTRWLVERDAGTGGLPEPAWGRFFPRGYRQLSDADYTRFLPAFSRWNALRVGAMPMKFRLVRNSSFSEPKLGHPVSRYSPILNQLGTSEAEFNKLAVGALTVVQEPGAKPFLKGAILGLSRSGASNAPPELYLKLQDIPAPLLTGPDVGDYEFRLDFEVRKVAVEPGSRGELPTNAIDTQATEVQWWGHKTAVMPRRLIATYPVDSRPITPAAMDAGVPAAIVPPEPIVSTVPTQRPVQNISDNFDVVGLRLGMDLIEAETIANKHMEVGETLTLAPASEATPTAYAHARVLVRSDKQEYIALLTEPSRSGSRIIAIGRYVFMGLGQMKHADLVASLTEKYGQNLLRNEALLHWGFGSAGRITNACVPKLGTLTAGIWKDSRGNAVDLRSLAPPASNTSFRGPASMPWIGLQISDLNQPSAYASCSSTITAWAPEMTGQAAEFAVWMTDPKAYFDILRKLPTALERAGARPKL